MISNPIIFYTASTIIIVFAIATILQKNIIYSLLNSIMVFFTTAIFFYMLGSEYNAIIQAAIYGFAVPIIIGLSIMFTTWKKVETKNFLLPMLIVVSSVLFVLLFADIIVVSNIDIPDTFHYVEIQQTNAYDILSSFARGIYINYVWAFELLSLLLTIVIAGFTMFRKRGGRTKNV